MKINSKTLGLSIFVIFFGAILFTTLMGWWQTETNKVPVKFEAGEAAGEYNPADIRGSYTFGDVSQLFEIPLEDLGAAFQIPPDFDLAALNLSSMEDIYGELPEDIGTGAVRLFVAFYKGLPYEITEESWLPAPSVEILEAQGKMTDDQSEYLASHTVTLDGSSSPAAPETQREAPDTAAPPDAEEDHIAPDKTVVGSTTFQELIEWGVSQADIEKVLGTELPPLTTVVKDFAISRGLGFSTIKTQLQELIP